MIVTLKRITIQKQANSQHSAMNVIKHSQAIYHNFTTRITILADFGWWLWNFQLFCGKAKLTHHQLILMFARIISL